ncbi:WD40/YVTN/BNR-like repeat-containing protein [Bradyrhizobium guangdongense]|uniref:WD40/YVTN/BNR-like repeat-containing protein n=1 Tax=Bradyrhizobium guangdongense TaxID=1325090 RepID=UPI00112A69D6|nr:hypothetical protein [Bradyrhizobium guangdongense]
MMSTRRVFVELLTIALACVCQIVPASSWTQGKSTSDTVFKTLKIGGGGWITGIYQSDDGTTKVISTDTYGAYKWSEAEHQWQQLVTSQSMPSGDVGPLRAGNVAYVAVAPNDPSRLYMLHLGCMYVSSNTGTTWTKSAAFACVNKNIDTRSQTKIAIDPVNADVAYAGTPNTGLFITYDGGVTWTAASGVPGATGVTFTFTAIDRTSPVVAGKTTRIYAASSGSGFFISNDSGATWSAMAGSPMTVKAITVAADGILYAIDNPGRRNSIWKYASGTWINITPAVGNYTYASVFTDPFDARRIGVAQNAGIISMSLDRGARWSTLKGVAWGPCTAGNANILASSDIPWLGNTNNCWNSVSQLMFDPVIPDKLWDVMGIGVFVTTIKGTGSAPVTLQSQSAGIEQLVPNWIISPPGGKPLVFSWDKPIFYVDDPDVYPSKAGPSNTVAINAGWSGSFAPSDPTYVVCLCNVGYNVYADQSGYSTDGGQNWSQFKSLPTDSTVSHLTGGSIAASTPDNIAWAYSSTTGSIWYTTNGGVSWTRGTFPAEVPTLGERGWGGAYYLDRQILDRDQVQPATFYAYNYGPASSRTAAGTYRSTDGGANWTHVSRFAFPNAGYNAKLRSVPGQAGHLFFTAGPSEPTNSSGSLFYRSDDAGTTWKSVPNVNEVWAFGFGAAPPNASYPAIFIAGYVNHIWGVWRSDDNAATWVNLTTWPINSLDRIKAIEGDSNTYGTVYIAFGGSGYAYGRLQ